MTQEQLERLPKYAQNRIRVLERNLETLRERFAEIGDKNGNVIVAPYSKDGQVRFTDETVCFQMRDREPGSTVQGDISFRYPSIGRDMDHSTVIVRGSGPLVIAPQVTNAFTIKLNRHA